MQKKEGLPALIEAATKVLKALYPLLIIALILCVVVLIMMMAAVISSGVFQRAMSTAS